MLELLKWYEHETYTATVDSQMAEHFLLTEVVHTKLDQSISWENEPKKTCLNLADSLAMPLTDKSCALIEILNIAAAAYLESTQWRNE